MRTRQTDIGPRDDVPGIPPIATAVAAAEVEAMAVMKASAEVEVARIKGAIHTRTGTLSRSVASSVRRVPGGGVKVSFGAIRKVAYTTRKGSRESRLVWGGEGGKRKKQKVFAADFVDRGTGVYGPKGTTIRRKGLVPVAGGVREPSGKGQRAQGMFTAASRSYAARAPVLDVEIDGILTRHFEGGRR